MALHNPDEYIKKELTPDLYEKYQDGLLGRKRKNFCDDCMAVCIKRSREDKFYPKCNRGDDEFAKAATVGMPKAQAQLVTNTKDCVAWAKHEFNWEARWYQAQFLRCSSPKIALRCGRRAGKTAALAMKALHLAVTKPGGKPNESYTVLIIAPYENQLAKFFEYMRTALAQARTIKVIKDKQDPQTLEFATNARVLGFTAGQKTGARSDKIRGQDGHAIVIDEADQLRDNDVDAILAILASHEDCRLYFSSTPSGLPTKFKTACETPDMGFKEFWFTSHESPAYSDDVDIFFKRMFGRIEFEHEILADFGLPEGGVFMPEPVHNCLENYPLGQPIPPDEFCIIGVDCNDVNNGTHAVVLSAKVVDGRTRFRVVDKQILRGAEFSPKKSEEMLLKMYSQWNPVLLAFDKGYAHGQISNLREHAWKHPESKLIDALKEYDLGSSYKYTDPLTGQDSSRPMKPIMVGLSQRVVQEGLLVLPKSEDVQNGIAGQMLRFHIKSVGATGQPKYSGGNEHTLTAMMIGILAWVMEISGFDPIQPSTQIISTSPSDVPDDLPLPVPNESRKLYQPSVERSMDDEVGIRRVRRGGDPWGPRQGTGTPTRRKMF